MIASSDWLFLERISFNLPTGIDKFQKIFSNLKVFLLSRSVFDIWQIFKKIRQHSNTKQSDGQKQNSSKSVFLQQMHVCYLFSSAKHHSTKKEIFEKCSFVKLLWPDIVVLFFEDLGPDHGLPTMLNSIVTIVYVSHSYYQT